MTSSDKPKIVLDEKQKKTLEKFEAAIGQDTDSAAIKKVTDSDADLRASGGFVWCEPCPYNNRPGCWAFVGDCQ